MRAGVRPENAKNYPKYAGTHEECARAGQSAPKSDQNVAKFHRAHKGVHPCGPECVRSTAMQAGVRPETAQSVPQVLRNAPGVRPCGPECARSAPMRAGVRPENAKNMPQVRRNTPGVRPCGPECARSAPSMSQFVKAPGAENA